MKRFAALAALTVALAAAAAPASARDGYVVDGAHLLSSSAISTINNEVSAFHAQTGKEVVVVTTPSLGGASATAAVEQSFAQQGVNGVEIFIAQQPHTIRIVGDRASASFFPAGSFQAIYQAMRPSFNAGNYDQGVITAVDLILNTYRGHESSQRVPAGYAQRASTGQSGLGFIWWIIILAVVFFVIRAIFRAMARPRVGPGGYGAPGAGPGPYGAGPYGAGYGGYGYGGGFGGGGFWSGLLGGLGGAWLGNELFNRGGGFGAGPGTYAGMDPNAGAGLDAGGWQSDPGQIDTSTMGGGDWGGGGGDFGGGGFGGGDGGGGW